MRHLYAGANKSDRSATERKNRPKESNTKASIHDRAREQQTQSLREEERPSDFDGMQVDTH